jgi:hypothetical protein
MTQRDGALTGVVTHYDATRGYGMLQPDNEGHALRFTDHPLPVGTLVTYAQTIGPDHRAFASIVKERR